MFLGIYSDPDYIQHHGIKGQKWGVRRYQNEDGTLTEKGKKKYSGAYRYTTKRGEVVDILTSKPRTFTTKIPDPNTNIEKEKTYEDTTHTLYVNGKKATIAYLDKYGSDTNINWLSTSTKYEGKGYAQTMMDHLIVYSKTVNGSKTMSLEVPDNDPNALHIYEKYGFKNTGTRWDKYGLTEMRKQL